MPRASRPDDPAGSTGAAPSWAADEASAEPAPQPAADTAQMPLFHADGPAPPRVRRARLRARIKTLLTARLKRKAAPAAAGEPSRPASSWPDSFFDHGGS
ncbi:hypothetical protein [Scleromatobacter humisilvae]|uniref:Uncharacterized protein n=1 Tax=Scleromatobacter humisilvae TaxID=2897159 RepID=A0A9X1YIR9_9BURK|nr:hypothetical protein [Scleromatobacter humisilvae]MCK9686918.1 hypothetical protein [Scleromatobacter humisilvae]